MTMKKAAVFIVSFLLLALALFPQSLAELAKKEKERRESLKGKKISVVTEAELAKVKLEPAISVALPENAVVPGQGLPAEQPQQQQQQPQPAEKAQTPPPRTEAQDEPAILKDVSGENPNELAKKHERAKERLDLLTLKMNALWQQFYSLDNMMPQAEVQRQISETYAKLLQAQEEEAAAREELQRALALRKK